LVRPYREVKILFRDGLGENSEFAGYHPAVNLTYFVFVIGITMFSTNPLFLTASFAAAWIYSVILRGKKAVRTNILFMIPVMVVMTLINTFFTHNGSTVLFYVNTNRITLEALVYGFAASVILSAVIIWFTCFNTVMTSDKFIYLFGRTWPVFGLLLSMTFRFIGLLKNRYREISDGQKCMGRDAGKSFMMKARQITKEISILISWSLEASIETADSMEARGYGLKGRTFFSLFRFTAKDRAVMIWTVIFGGISLAGCILKKTVMYYYPSLEFPQPDMMTAVTLTAFVLLIFIPVIIDIYGEIKWKRSESEI